MEFLNNFCLIFNEVTKNQFYLSNLRIGFLKTLLNTKENLSSIINLYYNLGDRESKNIFLKILQKSLEVAMSGKSVDFKFFTSQQWSNFEKEALKFDHVENDYILDRIETFVLEGYNYNNIICPQKGDIVFDFGAFTGNTALWFSKAVGDTGHVYSFEPMPDTFTLLSNNIKLKQLNNVSVINKAVADENKIVNFSGKSNPGSRIVNNGGIQIEAISIDNYIKENNIEKADFIKMDIEGAEAQALLGATQTIKKYKPDLAICAYHKNDDFLILPKIIKEINKDYIFYLKHNSHNFWETVLFATVKQNKKEEINIDCKNEIAISFNLINSIINLINNKNSTLKREKLIMYDELLRDSYKLWWLQPQTNFTYPEYIYYPLSKDHRLHYEFVFFDHRLHITLHFEGQYSDRNNIIQEIIKENNLQIPLLKNNGRYNGCSYILEPFDDPNFVVSIMKYLINISLPILEKYKLLDDKIFLKKNLMNNNFFAHF